MKICILGNSHVSAIKKGWDLVSANYPDITFDFVIRGQGKGAISTLETDGQVIRNAKGDKFPRAMYWTTPKREVEIVDYDYYIFVATGVPVNGLEATYSSSLLNVWKEELRSFKTIFKLASGITKCSKPVLLISAPFVSNTNSGNKYVDYHNNVERFNEVFREDNIQIIHQPIDTVVNEMAETKAIYAKEDNVHMNEEFGKLVVSDFIEKILSK